MAASTGSAMAVAMMEALSDLNIFPHPYLEVVTLDGTMCTRLVGRKVKNNGGAFLGAMHLLAGDAAVDDYLDRRTHIVERVCT